MKPVWVISCRLPVSRMKCLLSVVDNTFALALPNKDGTYNKVLSWDTREEAEKHLKDQLVAAPQAHKLGPFEIEQWIGEASMEPLKQ